MKPNMKKKFDFSAEMSEAEAIKATPKNEYLEEEKQLLDINAQKLKIYPTLYMSANLLFLKKYRS